MRSYRLLRGRMHVSNARCGGDRMSAFNESIVEEPPSTTCGELGYTTAFGPNLAPDGERPERASFEQVYLYDRLREAAPPDQPGSPRTWSTRRSSGWSAPSRRTRSPRTPRPQAADRRRAGRVPRRRRRGAHGPRPAHRLRRTRQQRLAGGQPVHDRRATRTAGPTCWSSSTASRSALLELKNPADEHATLKTAWNQVQTYRTDIPAVFTPNAVTVISDGTQRGDELVHRRLRALRAVEDHRRPRRRHRASRRSRCCSRASSSRRGSSTSSGTSSSSATSQTGWSSGSRSTTSTGPSTPPSSRPSRPPARR